MSSRMGAEKEVQATARPPAGGAGAHPHAHAVSKHMLRECKHIFGLFVLTAAASYSHRFKIEFV